MTRHLLDNPSARDEARVARSMGLTMSQWDALSDYDRAWALAADVADGLDATERCKACGGLKAECQNFDNQHAYEVTEARCFRTLAHLAAQRKRAADLDGVQFIVTLNPAKKKSATRNRG